MRFVVSVLTGIVFFLSGCSRRQEIVVGALFPITGNAATFGQSSKQGMQLAVDEVNRQGGIEAGGRKKTVRAIYEDTEGSPEKAANACQKLISQNRATAIVGEVMSKNSLAMAPICQDAQVPMISPASTNIKAAAPDFLYCPNYYAADATIMKQAREIGLYVPAGGGDGWDSPQLAEIGGPSVEGCVFSNHFSKDDTSAVVQNFVRRYREQYGAEPDALASLAYDAATILLNAMAKAASTQGPKIKEALRTISVNGVSGKIAFDEKRNPIKSAVILRIENGAQRYVTTVNP